MSYAAIIMLFFVKKFQEQSINPFLGNLFFHLQFLNASLMFICLFLKLLSCFLF